MAVQPETPLQRKCRELIEKAGGYANKNHGSMITKPGIADITACLKGFYLAIETKVPPNEPTPAQGIHCRNVQKAGGITVIITSVAEMERLLCILIPLLDELNDRDTTHNIYDVQRAIKLWGFDDGTGY